MTCSCGRAEEKQVQFLKEGKAYLLVLGNDLTHPAYETSI